MEKVVNVDSYQDIPGVTYCSLPDLPKLLRSPSLKGVVVCNTSDWSICYQHEHPIVDDMEKDILLNLRYYLEKHKNESDGMEPFRLPARCHVEKCHLDNKYSIKIDTITKCTSDLVVPDGVVVYTTNCNIKNNNFRPLPFGVNKHDDVHIFEGFDELEKEDKLYLNFSEHTAYRRHINNHFLTIADRNAAEFEREWLTLITKEDPNGPAPLKHEEYLYHIATHKFILCPTGVGFDCFRVWEALALNSIPVMERNHWNEWMAGIFPVVLVDNFQDITSIDYLLDRCPTDEQLAFYNKEFLTENYWRAKIAEEVKRTK